VPSLTNTQKNKGELNIQNSSERRQWPAMTKKARVANEPITISTGNKHQA